MKEIQQDKENHGMSVPEANKHVNKNKRKAIANPILLSSPKTHSHVSVHDAPLVDLSIRNVGRKASTPQLSETARNELLKAKKPVGRPSTMQACSKMNETVRNEILNSKKGVGRPSTMQGCNKMNETACNELLNSKKAVGRPSTRQACSQMNKTDAPLLDLSKRKPGRKPSRSPLTEISESTRNQGLHSQNSTGIPGARETHNQTNQTSSKGKRTPPPLSPGSIQAVKVVRPRGRLRKSQISTQTPVDNLTPIGSLTPKNTIPNVSFVGSGNTDPTSKETFIRNNNGSRFRNQTPVKFNLGSTSSKRDKVSNGQSSLLASEVHKLKGRMVTRQSARRINFNQTECEVNKTANRHLFVGISEDYLDHGDPTFECESCGAMLWHAESIRGAAIGSSESYSSCCGRGKVKLGTELKEPPELLKQLIKNEHPKSASFIDNIRRYNSMFAFTSMGAQQDHSVNVGRGPYCYRIHGENYHLAGTLLPKPGETPKFSQLYIVDTENEIRNRMNAVSNESHTSSQKTDLDSQLTKDIRDMLDSINPLVQDFRMAGERMRSFNDTKFCLKLIGTRERDGRQYNLPTASEVAALIVGDFDETKNKRDIILHQQDGDLKRISELHPSYLALQYPLFFPRAEDRYRTNIFHEGVTDYDETNKGTRVTMREWFTYRVQERKSEFSMMLNGRRLFQQFLVDGYTMVESERMSFNKKQQKELRSETYSKLAKLADDEESGVRLRGRKVVLPSSFTGSPRYMMQNYLDAMTICKFYGYPDLFITFTCNPNWPEISRFMADRGLKSEDRPDVITRVFKIKLDSLMADLKDRRTFGRVKGAVYTVEFQKRGLPHAHILLWLQTEDKITTTANIDKYISAEIPNKEEDPKLYQIVTDHMMHGPCGHDNPSCPCTVDFKCTKNFPKKFNETTLIDDNGYGIYRRRNDGSTIKKNGTDLHNGFVVPYNPGLLRRYQSHINVEWCNQVGSIKYLFKYINKGPDRVTVGLDGEEIDEIKDFYDCRYLSACEAAWRIFKFDIHYRTPSVERLPFHLQDEQSVVFDATESIDYTLEKESVNHTKFVQWMELNRTDPFARTLLYVEIPKFYVWNPQKRIWTKRQRGFSLGRIHHVPLSWGEYFYLRVLLNKVRGPQKWEDIREYEVVVHPTYRDACYARGLLQDDKEYIDGLLEASHWGMGDYLRSFFVMLLMTAEIVWEKTWHVLAADVEHIERKKRNNPGLQLSDDQKYNICLTYIEHMLLCNNKSLKSWTSMPFPKNEYLMEGYNRLIYDETSYNKDELKEQHKTLYCSLTDEQKGIYATVMEAIEQKKGGMFFVYGYGGTGKTYLYKTMSAALRSKGDIVLNVASSGIAALLLEGGRTAHSRFSIPINIVEDSMCHIPADSDLADLIRQAKLIIWDGAPMIQSFCYEAFDRTLHDICRSDPSQPSNLVFGGKVVIFGGDFRQILPIIPNASHNDVVHATINSSYLWTHCKVMQLTVNMRLGSRSTESERKEIQDFADWILDIGNRKDGGKNDGNSTVVFLDEMLIPESDDYVGSIIDAIYPRLRQNLWNPEFFQERAILSPTHDMVDMINERMLDLIEGDETIYESSDSVSLDDADTNFDDSIYTIDFLNGIRMSGIPQHAIKLKVGTPVMLMRNIDQKAGLCNGTRLQVQRLGINVIEAKIIAGGNVGQICAIPQMVISPSETKMPFKFNRRQFPIQVYFGMTINKSQGQTLSQVGLYLPQPVFSHGQLYVALSRVKSKRGLKVLCLDREGNYCNYTSNVVYKEVLCRI